MQSSTFKKKNLHNQNKFIWLICAAIGASTLQIAAIFVGPGVDASGLVAIQWIAKNNLQIGTDLIYQFGPLGYLYVQTYEYQSLWLQALSYNFFIHFFYIFSVGLLVVKLRTNWKDKILVFSLLLILSNAITSVIKLHHQETITIIIILYLIITGKISKKYALPTLPFLSLLLAVESLMLNHLALVSISIIATYSLISIAKKEFKKPLIFAGSYIFFIFILWIASIQDISNLPSYFINIFSFSAGYTYAQAIDGLMIQTISGLVTIGFLGILFIYSLTKKFNNVIIFMLLSAVLLFVEFKHGFVRHDNHVLHFYFTYGTFFICTYIIFKYDILQAVRNNKRLVLLIVLIIGSILLVASIGIVDSKIFVPKISNILSYSEVLPLIFDKSYEANRVNEHQEYLKGYHSLDEFTIQHIGNKTMDVIPWDLMIPWIYDFNWSPSPMPWAFQVYSTQIDESNAQHFSGDEAPEVILYSYKSIDNRYPLFDEPITFATILKNYQYTHTTNEHVILSYNPRQDMGEKEDLGTVIVKVGEPIKIPRYEKGYVFAHVDLNFSTLGKIANTVYKPYQAHVIFKFSDSTYSKEFRFIPGSSSGGVFVSQFVEGVHDLESIFSGKITLDIDEMIIQVDDPSHYEHDIEVRFVGLPAQISIKQTMENKVPDWDSLKLIQGGSMYIDFVGNKPFYQEGNIINISGERQRFIGITGWAVDGLSQDGTVKTFLVLTGKDKEIILPTRKVLRPDVSKFFGVDSYQYSGWSTAFDTEELEEGCYTLSIRIPRTNGQEYFELNSEKSICFGDVVRNSA